MPVTPLCALISVVVSEFTRRAHIFHKTARIELHFGGKGAHSFKVDFFFGWFNRNNFRYWYSIACNRYLLPQNRMIYEL